MKHIVEWFKLRKKVAELQHRIEFLEFVNGVEFGGKKK